MESKRICWMQLSGLASTADIPLKLQEYKRKIFSFLHSIKKLCVLLGISCMHYIAYRPQRFSASMSYAWETG
jgi:hypothetical protein